MKLFTDTFSRSDDPRSLILFKMYTIFRKAIFFFLLLFRFLSAWSQFNVVDSLNKMLETASGFHRASILTDLSNALVFSQTWEALAYAEEAYRIASDSHKDSLKFAALKAMGYANGYLGNFEISLQNMKEGLAWYERNNDSLKMAEALSDIAYLLQRLSSDEEDIMEYNQRALAIREQIGDEKGIAYSLNNIGALYWDWDKHDVAIRYFLKAAPFFEKLGLDEEVATALSNIGSFYTETGEYFLADSFQNLSLEIHRKIGHKNGEAQNLINLARICLLQNDFARALQYNMASLKIRETIGDREGQVGNFYNIAFIFYRENKVEEAWQYLLRSLEISEEIGLKSRQIQIYELLAKVSEKAGSFQKAYHYLQKSKNLNDSVFSVEKHRQLEEIRAKYDFEKKAAENEQLLIENENQRLTLERNRLTLYMFAGIAALILVIMFLVFMRAREGAKLRDLTLEHQLIRSQMNPHFIFNTITAIQNYIIQHSPREAVNFLSQFASLMRQTLSHSRKELITLDNEIESLKNYLGLQQLRFPGHFEYRMEVDENVNPAQTLVPPMLIQPFVENSIEHGFKGNLYQGFIRMSWKRNDKMLFIEIEDNGVGVGYQKHVGNFHHEPFAIQATHERLRMINKKKKIQFEVIDWIAEDKNSSGTRVRFSIPFQTSD